MRRGMGAIDWNPFHGDYLVNVANSLNLGSGGLVPLQWLPGYESVKAWTADAYADPAGKTGGLVPIEIDSLDLALSPAFRQGVYPTVSLVATGVATYYGGPYGGAAVGIASNYLMKEMGYQPETAYAQFAPLLGAIAGAGVSAWMSGAASGATSAATTGAASGGSSSLAQSAVTQGAVEAVKIGLQVQAASTAANKYMNPPEPPKPAATAPTPTAPRAVVLGQSSDQKTMLYAGAGILLLALLARR